MSTCVDRGHIRSLPIQNPFSRQDGQKATLTAEQAPGLQYRRGANLNPTVSRGEPNIGQQLKSKLLNKEAHAAFLVADKHAHELDPEIGLISVREDRLPIAARTDIRPGSIGHDPRTGRTLRRKRVFGKKRDRSQKKRAARESHGKAYSACEYGWDYLQWS